jgi:hypothetical protein
VSIDASPPAQPPQMSPDGNWVWDGSQWQPVTGVAPTHEGVFAAYAQKVEAGDQVVAAGPPAVVGAPVEFAAPAVDYSYPAAEPTGALWEQPKGPGKTTYLYAGAAFVVLLIAMIVLNSLNLVQLPGFGSGSHSSASSSSSPTPVVSPGPAPVRSEFGRADLFLNGSLAPTLVAFEQTVPAMATCSARILSNSCFNALTATDPLMKDVLAVIDKGPIPLCIAASMKQYRSDFAVMEAGVQLALKGYKDDQVSELIDGEYRFRTFVQYLAADANVVAQAKARCSTDREGP